MYILSESEKKQTFKIVEAVKSIINSTDVKSVYKKCLLKKKQFDKRVSKARTALQSMNIDVNHHIKKVKEMCDDFSIMGIIKTVGIYWENAKKTELNPEINHKAFLLFLICVIPGLFGEWILSFGLGKETSDIIGSVLFAPLFEELAKYLSVKQGVHQEFWKLFNMVEFFAYVVKPFFLFIAFPSVTTTAIFGVSLIVRFIVVMMHTINTMIHKKELDSGNTKRGLVIGILIHMFWNGVLSNIVDGKSFSSLKDFIVGEFVWAGSALSFLLLVGAIYKKIINKEDEVGGVEPAYA